MENFDLNCSYFSTNIFPNKLYFMKDINVISIWNLPWEMIHIGFQPGGPNDVHNVINYLSCSPRQEAVFKFR